MAQQVANVIRAELLSGGVLPGARISDETLAAELGVSRNTAREAMQILASEGLVDRTLHRGAVVKEVTAGDLADIYQTRRVLERTALAAAAAAGPQWLREVQASFDRMKAAGAAGDALGVMQGDLAFHEAIVAALGSARISRFYRSIQAEIRLARGWHSNRPPIESILERHDELVKLLEREQFEQAAERLLAMLDGGETRLREALTGGEQPPVADAVPHDDEVEAHFRPRA